MMRLASGVETRSRVVATGVVPSAVVEALSGGGGRAVASGPVVLSLTQLAGRIRTGCVYEEQPAGTFGLLVTRHDPRTRWRRSRVVQAPIDAYWGDLAPSVRLLTGCDAGCRARHYGGTNNHAGHLDGGGPPSPLGWDGFAAAYRAELERWPFLVQRAVVRQIARWLRSYRTVTILSFEPSMPRGAALLAWERRGEFVPWAQRHVFREWLLRLPAVELCVVGGVAARQRRVLMEGGVVTQQPGG